MRPEGKVLPNRYKTLPPSIILFDPCAASLRDCRAHSAPLSCLGERIWHQRGRGAVRIEYPNLSITKIVYYLLIFHRTQIACPHDFRGVDVRRVVNPIKRILIGFISGDD